MFLFALAIILLLNNSSIIGMNFTQLCVGSYNTGNYDKLLEYGRQVTPQNAISLAGQGRAHRKLAELAAQAGDTAKAEKHLASAFLFFQEAASFIDSYNGDAKKYYEHFLKHGIGWDYNPETEINYFAKLYQESTFDTEKERARKSISRLAQSGNEYACNTLTQLEQKNRGILIAPSDFLSACTSDNEIIDCCLNQLPKYNQSATNRTRAIEKLSQLAQNGNMRAQCILVSAKYNITQSPEDILLHCQNYIIARTLISNEQLLPLERNAIRLSLKHLCKHKNDKAITLRKYHELLMANSASQQDKIMELSAENPILKLICSNYNGSQHTYLKAIKQMQPTDKTIKNLDPILIAMLTQLLANASTDDKKKLTAIHYIFGLHFYNSKNYNEAYKHFSQCTLYNNDLFTQALKLTSHCFMHEGTIQETLRIIAQLNLLIRTAEHNNTMTPRDIKAKNLTIETYKLICRPYTQQLRETKNYDLLYQLSNYFLDINETFNEGANIILNIEADLEHQPIINNNAHTNTWTKITTLANQKNHSSNKCLHAGVIFTQKTKNTSLSFNEIIYHQKEAFKYLACSFTHNDLSAQQIVYNKAVCSTYAHTIGKAENSIEYLDQAIKYGESPALVTKARILQNSPTLTASLQREICNLYLQHTQSDDYKLNRAHSFNALAAIYDKFEDIEHKKKCFDCLSAAAALDNYDNAITLGNFYREGIPNYLEPNADKAFYYFSQAIMHNKKTSFSIQNAYVGRAIVYYQQNKFQEALDDLKNNLSDDSHIDLTIKATSAWFSGMIAMHQHTTESIIDDIVPYLDLAHTTLKKSLNQNSYDATEVLQAQTDHASLTRAQQKTKHILAQPFINANAVQFCYLIGAVVWHQTKNKSITDECRIHAIECLKLAANHNHTDAQIFLHYTSNKETSIFEKITHLDAAYAKTLHADPTTATQIQNMLDHLYPSAIEHQALLIALYTKHTGHELLEKYVTRMYDIQSPVINNDKPENMQRIIEPCYGDQFLISCVNNFQANPTAASKRDRNAAVFLASLYIYSNDQDKLRKGLCLLENARLDYPMQNVCVKKNRGLLLFQLGTMQKNSTLLANCYYQKSAENGNIPSIVRLTNLWVSDPTKAPGLTSETVFDWITGIPIIQLDTVVEITINRYLQKYSNSDFIRNKNSQTATDTMLLFKLQNSAESHNKKYLEALNASHKNSITEKHIATFKSLADNQKNPHPHAAILVAISYCIPNTDLSTQYLVKGIANGITSTDNINHNLFKDALIMELITQYVDYLITHKEPEAACEIIRILKTTLDQYKINTDAFARALKTKYGHDLTQYPQWMDQ